MADCIGFPNTMNEFMEQYSFIDTDEVYTNGSELIQVFRVKQGLEHYEEEIRSKAIEEFSERIKARAHSTERNDWSADYMISIWESVIDEIAMEMKGE